MQPRAEKKNLSKFYTCAKTIACSFALFLAFTAATEVAVAGKDGAGLQRGSRLGGDGAEEPADGARHCRAKEEAIAAGLNPDSVPCIAQDPRDSLSDGASE